jgi:predicted TPR repeat methyltransferase
VELRAQFYEQQRYAILIRTLADRGYQRAFEPGCSIGVLAQMLAPLCVELEAMDISSVAVSHARKSCRNLSNVSIRCGALPESIPGGMFDLIVFSEIGYYFEKPQLQCLVSDLTAKLFFSGTLVAAHWLGVSNDHILSGDQVHQIIRANSNLSLRDEKCFPSFRLDRLERI